ncbi:MAG TPA: hypothetical protein VET23_06245, partial [Chitinophagaceae bacterium]|nr:hypothetical protein [Chitinophagaceae bacterium]
KFTNFNTLSFGTYIGGTASGSTTVVNDFQLLSNGDVVFAGSTTQIAEINGTVSGNTTGSDVLFGHIAVPASGSVTFTVVEKLGGSGTDHGNGIYALGDSVSILVGSTKSNNFPLGTGTPFQSSSGGSTDGFVARIRNDGTGGYKASYVGGSGSDLFVSVRPIIVGNQAALLCFGTTSSSNLPVINYNAETFYNATNSGGLDMMFLICDMNLNTKYYLSYIGGTDNDYLGATGTPVGSNHLFYNTVDSVLYVGTTTHSYDSTQNPKFVGRGINDVSNNGVPVFDQVKNNSNNDTHVIFAISTANIYSLLAAKWLSFDVKLNSGCGVRLIWTMTGETPGSQYTIERSSDSRYFEAIGTLVAGSQQYSYTDAAASSFTGILYYRIRSTEPGGYTSYSKINAVSLCDGGQESIKIYPTITSNYVSIKAQNFTSPKDVMIRLFDAFGNTVMQKRIRLVNGISQFLFDRRYSLGNYILSIKDQATGELLRQEKIIIRN